LGVIDKHHRRNQPRAQPKTGVPRGGGHRQAGPDPGEFLLDAVVKGGFFTVPGDGSLDFAAIGRTAGLVRLMRAGSLVEGRAGSDSISPPAFAMAKKKDNTGRTGSRDGRLAGL